MPPASLSPLAKRHTHKPPALVTEALTILEAALGGRDALVAALSHAPKSADLSYVLGLIGDPLHAKDPLATLCASGGITVGELIAAYTSGEVNRAQALATSKVGAKLGEVAADTVRMSLPREQLCMSCDGVGQVTPEPTKKVPNPEPHECEACRGSGQISVEGDLEHKKLVLEMGKMLQKGPGLSVNVNQQLGVAFGSAGGALEKLQIATDAILYGDQTVAEPIMDVEVIQDAEEPTAEVETDWRGDNLV